jgi:hypothetical protein
MIEDRGGLSMPYRTGYSTAALTLIGLKQGKRLGLQYSSGIADSLPVAYMHALID